MGGGPAGDDVVAGPAGPRLPALVPGDRQPPVSALGTEDRSAEPAVVFVLQDGELRGTLGTLLDIVQLLQVRLLLPDLGVQRSEDVPSNLQGGLPGVERLDGEEQELQPLLLLSLGRGVQLHGLLVVPHVEGVGSDQVVPLQHLEVVHLKLGSETELRP